MNYEVGFGIAVVIVVKRLKNIALNFWSQSQIAGSFLMLKVQL